MQLLAQSFELLACSWFGEGPAITALRDEFAQGRDNPVNRQVDCWGHWRCIVRS